MKPCSDMEQRIQAFLYQLEVETIVHSVECNEILNDRINALRIKMDEDLLRLETLTPTINRIKQIRKQDELKAKRYEEALGRIVHSLALCHSLNNATN